MLEQLVESYSINLMWINKDRQVEQECNYIAPVDQHEKFIEAAIGWAKQNPQKMGAQIDIWYDSALCSSTALINSQSILNEKAAYTACSNIKFRDIRDLVIVKQNSHLFTENMPLYYKIDLLKLIICHSSLRFELKDAAIFSDLETCNLRENKSRFNKEELFDEDTMSKLSEAGIVRNYDIKVENQFLQFLNNDNIIRSLEYNINSCMMACTNTLNTTKKTQDIIMPCINHIVYEACVEGIPKYYQAIKNNTLKIKTEKSELEKYDPKIHGYEALGNFFFPSVLKEVVCVKFIPNNDPEVDVDTKSYLSENSICRIQSNLKISRVPIDFGFEGEYELDVGHRKTGTREGNYHIDEYKYKNHDENYICVMLDSFNIEADKLLKVSSHVEKLNEQRLSASYNVSPF